MEGHVSCRDTSHDAHNRSLEYYSTGCSLFFLSGSTGAKFKLFKQSSPRDSQIFTWRAEVGMS